jgi:hypothetical protein
MRAGSKYTVNMPEQLSDERFTELFGEGVFKKSTSSSLSVEIRNIYIGKRPSEIDISQATSFLTNSNCPKTGESLIPVIDYFLVLPSVLRAFSSASTAELTSSSLSSFFSLYEDLEPTGLNVQESEDVFRTIGYGPQQVDYMIFMIREIKRKFLLQDQPLYVAPKGDFEIGKALEAGIDSLTQILKAMQTL